VRTSRAPCRGCPRPWGRICGASSASAPIPASKPPPCDCATTSRRSARCRRSRITCRAGSSTTRASSAGCGAASRRFYKPARLNGVDYVDGGVRHTANIDIAIEKGADLIICYNPFRPFLNRIDAGGGETPYFADGRYLSDRGLKVVVNQVFRTLLHSRLKVGIQRYLTDDRFRGDIVLLEPRERDANFFAMNPLAFWKRSEAVQHGFESVRTTIEQNFDQLAEVFGSHGLRMDRAAARRRAEKARRTQGWAEPPEAEPETEARPLRLVGSRGA
jgi:predicted acylesterase/phospholipase RssA